MCQGEWTGREGMGTFSVGTVGTVGTVGVEASPGYGDDAIMKDLGTCRVTGAWHERSNQTSRQYGRECLRCHSSSIHWS